MLGSEEKYCDRHNGVQIARALVMRRVESMMMTDDQMTIIERRTEFGVYVLPEYSVFISVRIRHTFRQIEEYLLFLMYILFNQSFPCISAHLKQMTRSIVCLELENSLPPESI